MRVVKSPAILLLLLLIIADIFVLDFKIKRDEQAKSNLISNETRIPALRNSIEHAHKADVLLLGSSLVVTAFTYPDFNLGLAPIKQLDDSYIQSRLLSDLIQKRTGKAIDAANLSCLAATPADALLIVNELAKRNKLPETVVYGIEPRALADNLTPVGGALGGAAALELENQYHNPNWIQQAEMALCNSSALVLPKAAKDNINELRIKLARLGEVPEPNDVNEIVASHFWQLFGARKYLGEIAQEKANSIFKSKANVSKQIKVECVSKDSVPVRTVSANKPWDTVSAQKLQKQLDQYRGHYLPCNKVKMKKNMVLLQKLAQKCQTNGSTLYLVKMPITKENFNLVPPETARGYDSILQAVEERYHCKLVDLRDGFEQTDFMDTVHLNAQGGEKLQRKLVGALDCSLQ